MTLTLIECTDKERWDRFTEESPQGSIFCLTRFLDALEEDHEFLLRGGVFTQDVIDEWISFKREHEVDAVALRPHPWEFHLYYDI